MREKIVSRRRPTLKIVNLPNGTSFVSRYERISRKQSELQEPEKWALEKTTGEFW